MSESNNFLDEGVERGAGIIVMIDVLGVRDLSINKCAEFIKHLNQLVKDIEKQARDYTAKFKELLSQDARTHIFPEPKIVVFADTILLMWKIDRPGFSGFDLLYAAQVLKPLFRKALSDYGLLLRGSISIGKYIMKNSTVLGPAIADAAVWCDIGNWAGIIITPNTGINLHFWSFDPTIDQCFVYYPVPLNNGKSLKLWCLSWPQEFYEVSNIPHGKTVFFNLLSGIGVAAGAEWKHANIIDFFTWFGDDIMPKIVAYKGGSSS